MTSPATSLTVSDAGNAAITHVRAGVADAGAGETETADPGLPGSGGSRLRKRRDAPRHGPGRKADRDPGSGSRCVRTSSARRPPSTSLSLGWAAAKPAKAAMRSGGRTRTIDLTQLQAAEGLHGVGEHGTAVPAGAGTAWARTPPARRPLPPAGSTTPTEGSASATASAMLPRRHDHQILTLLFLPSSKARIFMGRPRHLMNPVASCWL